MRFRLFSKVIGDFIRSKVKTKSEKTEFSGKLSKQNIKQNQNKMVQNIGVVLVFENLSHRHRQTCEQKSYQLPFLISSSVYLAFYSCFSWINQTKRQHSLPLFPGDGVESQRRNVIFGRNASFQDPRLNDGQSRRGHYVLLERFKHQNQRYRSQKWILWYWKARKNRWKIHFEKCQWVLQTWSVISNHGSLWSWKVDSFECVDI